MELNKIIFSDSTIFQSVAAPYEPDVPIFSRRSQLSGELRDTLRITVTATYAEVADKFKSGAEWAIRQYDIDENGAALDTYTDFDKSDYSVCGDIVDHRDGRVTVYMGKKTESEITQDALDELMLMMTEVL